MKNQPGSRAASRLVRLSLALSLVLLAGCNYPTGDQIRTTPRVSSLSLTLAAIDAAATAAGEPGGTVTSAAPTGAVNMPGGVTSTPPPPGLDSFPLPTAGPLPETLSYITQSGDTLPAIAERFEVGAGQIDGGGILPPDGYLVIGTPLSIPNRLAGFSYPGSLFPDSEVILSPTAQDFDVETFVRDAGGFLASYSENVDGELLPGAQIIERVAVERSVNPRLLLAFLQHRSQWVFDQPAVGADIRHPIGFYASGYAGLYDELTLTANHLNIGYYDWRVGELNNLRFKGGRTARLSPSLNPGTVAVQNLFAKFYEQAPWEIELYGEDNFSARYVQAFGSPWDRAAAVEPLLSPEVAQPPLELPFSPGETWSFSGGPHRTLTLGSPLGALDFSPVSGGPSCAVSPAWVTAPAGGLVTRSGSGILALDLDRDGYEGTGWVLLFLHIAGESSLPAGSLVERDEPLGHPSCEGGNSTGTHVHLARKYNGEWLAADGPVPFNLSGWVAQAGERSYEGVLTKDGRSIPANPGGSGSSLIERELYPP